MYNQTILKLYNTIVDILSYSTLSINLRFISHSVSLLLSHQVFYVVLFVYITWPGYCHINDCHCCHCITVLLDYTSASWFYHPQAGKTRQWTHLKSSLKKSFMSLLTPLWFWNRTDKYRIYRSGKEKNN